MSGTLVKLGPFGAGINNLHDPAAVADNELVDCVNFEVDLDGSLVSRPPIDTPAPGATFDSRLIVIGSALIGGVNYLLGSTNNAIWYYNGTAWAQITTGISSHCAIQYRQPSVATASVWFIAAPGSSKKGGWWHPSAPTTLNSIATMPDGYTGLIHKNRMYITAGILDTANLGSRVYFSKPTDASVWASPDGGTIDINIGDNQDITALTVYNDSILVFTRDSTYYLSFDTGPSQATIRRLSTSIGAPNRWCVINFENSVYLYHRTSVYELLNYQFQKLNNRVVFVKDTSGGTYSEAVFCTLVGTRLLVRYYNTVYVFNLRTKTWTRFVSTRYYGPFTPYPSDAGGLDKYMYISGSCIVGNLGMFVMREAADATARETFTCSITSKIYDIAASDKFKRLFWWGLDIVAVASVTGTLTPVVYNVTSTPTVNVSGALVGTANRRRFLRFAKGIRFRQAQFSVTVSTDGSTTQSPVRLYDISAFVTAHQGVSKAVT